MTFELFFSNFAKIMLNLFSTKVRWKYLIANFLAGPIRLDYFFPFFLNSTQKQSKIFNYFAFSINYFFAIARKFWPVSRKRSKNDLLLRNALDIWPKSPKNRLFSIFSLCEKKKNTQNHFSAMLPISQPCKCLLRFFHNENLKSCLKLTIFKQYY